jgi:hypothetical protein
MTQEALKQMVEALEESETDNDTMEFWGRKNKAIQAGKQAIAELESQEPVAYDKTEINFFVQDLYDKKMQEGKHGHYETMFHVVHQAIKRATPPQRTWVGLTDDEICMFSMLLDSKPDATVFTAIEARLKELNT